MSHNHTSSPQPAIGQSAGVSVAGPLRMNAIEKTAEECILAIYEYAKRTGLLKNE